MTINTKVLVSQLLWPWALLTLTFGGVGLGSSRISVGWVVGP